MALGHSRRWLSSVHPHNIFSGPTNNKMTMMMDRRRRRSLRQSTLIFFYAALTATITPNGVQAKKNPCVLPCRNKGVCAIHSGRRLLGGFSGRDEGGTTTITNEFWPRLLSQATTGTGRQYCKCPKGYIGPLCEISLVLCERPDQQCANGAICQRDVDGLTNGPYYHCECHRSKSDLTFDYSEKLCEHASTVFCAEDGSPLSGGAAGGGKRQSLGKSARGSFCVNGGTCLAKDSAEAIKTHHFGCHCPPGFSGSHCEVADFVVAADQTKKKTLQSVLMAQQQQQQAAAGAGHWLWSFFMFLLFILGSMLLGLAALIRHGNRHRQPNRTRKTAQDRARIPDQQRQPVLPVQESEIELS